MAEEKVTWEKLIELEPGLLALYNEACQVKDPGEDYQESFCANRVWHQNFKPRLIRLVGWEARNQDSLVASDKAYELALQKIYDQLPDCRNCGCL